MAVFCYPRIPKAWSALWATLTERSVESWWYGRRVYGVDATGVQCVGGPIRWRVRDSEEALENLNAAGLWPGSSNGPEAAQWTCACPLKPSPCLTANWTCGCLYCKFILKPPVDCARAPYHVPPLPDIVAVACYGPERMKRAVALAAEAGMQGVEWAILEPRQWGGLLVKPPGCCPEWAARRARSSSAWTPDRNRVAIEKAHPVRSVV